MAQALRSRTALMVAGALAVHLRPKLAQDAKIDVTDYLADITAKNFKTRKASIFAALQNATRGKLAQDADLNDVVEFLDTLEDVTDGQVDGDMVEAAVEAGEDIDKPAVDADDDMMSKVLAFLEGKLSDDDMTAIKAMVDGDMGVDSADSDPKTGITKPAMDAAIRAAESRTEQRLLALRQAEMDVAPFIGKIKSPQANAAATYKLALDAMNVDTKGVPTSAYGALLKALPKPDSGTQAIAFDAAAGKNALQKRFPKMQTLVRS